MTIKQQGGIFGRNPDFNDVTAEELSSPSITSNGSIYNPSTDGGQSETFKVTAGLSSSSSAGQRFGGISFGSSDRVSSAAIAAVRTGSNDDHMGLGIYVHSANPQTDPAELAVTIDSNKNIVFANSGSGIDFSATSGTGTSELFSDYEEGNWTPTYTTNGTDFDSVTYDTAVTSARYTKVGNTVHIQGAIRTDAITVGSASGSIRIAGLPYTSVAGVSGRASIAIGSAANFAGEVPISGRLNSDVIDLFYRSAVDGNTANLQVADMDTGANDNEVYFSGTYTV